MTKLELLDGTLIALGQNSQDRIFLPQDIEWAADKIIASLVAAFVAKNGFGAMAEYVKTATLKPKLDTQRNLRYVDYQSLPETANPYYILSVSKLWDERKPFIWVKSGSLGIYDGLEASKLSQIQIWQENSRVYFDRLGWEVDEVLAKVLPNIASLEDMDRVPIPDLLESDLVQGIMQLLLSGERVEDKTNDGRQSQA